METNRPEAGNDRPVRCPACDALERHRFLWLFLNKHTDLFAGNKLRLIEFAPYRSFFNAFSSLPGLDYYPCDLHPDSLFYADLDGEIIRADITALTFPDQYFDVMLCSHVLEHVADDRAAIAEMHRVLRRDGWAVVQVPLDPSLAMTLEDERIPSPEEREKVFGQRDHLRLYGQDFIERLKQGGFVVREYRSGILGTDAIARYGLDPDDRLFLCRPAQGGHRSRNDLFR